jgi:hypothetical protein
MIAQMSDSPACMLLHEINPRWPSTTTLAHFSVSAMNLPSRTTRPRRSPRANAAYLAFRVFQFFCSARGGFWRIRTFVSRPGRLPPTR